LGKSASALFVRPNWADTIVNRRFRYLMDYLFWVGNSIVCYALETGLLFQDLIKDDATRSNVETKLKEDDPIFFFHASHGGENEITGQNMSNLICCPGTCLCSQANHTVLSGRIVYTLSCLSAKELGPEVINAGGISYIGYELPLQICVYEGYDMDGAFEDIWVGGAKALIEDKNTGEVYNWLKKRYQYWISYWEMRVHWVKPIILSCLRQDLRALKLLGKMDAKIR